MALVSDGTDEPLEGIAGQTRGNILQNPHQKIAHVHPQGSWRPVHSSYKCSVVEGSIFTEFESSLVLPIDSL